MHYKIKPWNHQMKAIELARNTNEYALFFEMGTGKTGTLINILREKFNKSRRILPTIIFSPPITLNNWKNEWLMHSDIDPDKVVILKGPRAQRVRAIQNAAPDSVIITNYESLTIEPVYKEMMKFKPEVLVADESHKIKSATAARTKLLVKLANKGLERVKYRYILTGTPVLNTPLDLFTQFLFLDGGQTFGDNFFLFRLRFFFDNNAGMPKHNYFPDWRLKKGALEEIKDLITRKGMYVKKTDCLDLPPFVTQVIGVGLTKEQEKAYTEMKKHLITFIEDKAVTAQLAIVKSLRLMQITSGFVSTEGGEVVKFEDTPKEQALKNLLEENAPYHKIIVWAVWKENYGTIRKICGELGIRCTELTGEVSEQERSKSIEAFTHDDSCRILIANPGAAGIGINLVCSDISIFYSRNYSLEQSLQAEARNYRGGSEIHQKVTRINLVCENTIDEAVTSALSSKEEISLEVLAKCLK